MATSKRVQQILAEVRTLSDDEKDQLETELLAEDAAVGQAWGTELDRRAAHVLATDTPGLTRDDLRAILAMSPSDARARLALLLADRK